MCFEGFTNHFVHSNWSFLGRKYLADFDKQSQKNVKGATGQSLTRNSAALLFSEAAGKELHSGIPAEVKERQRSAVSSWNASL